jgi:hypothetical protein
LRQLLLVAAGDFVMNEQTQEIGEGQLAVDGFAVARLQRIEDDGIDTSRTSVLSRLLPAKCRGA